jgi:hypothetical protein
MKNLFLNTVLIVALLFIFYTIYENIIRKKEGLQVLYPSDFNKNEDYLLSNEDNYKVLPFDLGRRVNYQFTCVNN